MESKNKKFATVSARCNLVTNSAEAKSDTELQKLVTETTKEIGSYYDTHQLVTAKKVELAISRKEHNTTKAQMVNVANLSLYMLESLKPTSEIGNHSIPKKKKLEDLKYKELVEQSTVIANQLKAKSEQLLAKGYKQDQIDDLSLIVQKSISIDSKLNQQLVEEKLLRNKRDNSRNQAEQLFDKMNAKVRLNKHLMPILYDEYFAIKIERNKSHHQNIEGNIVCEGKPLANASIQIISNETPKPRKNASEKVKAALQNPALVQNKVVYERLSNSNGEFITNKLKPGTYRARIRKNGYIEQEITLYINPKETTKINVNLLKLEITNN